MQIKITRHHFPQKRLANTKSAHTEEWPGQRTQVLGAARGSAGRGAGQTRTCRPAHGSRQTLASSQSELPGDLTLARKPGLRARPDLGQHLVAALFHWPGRLHLPRPRGRQRTSVTAERGLEAHSRQPSWAGRPGGSCLLQAPLEPGLTDICKGL